MKKLLLGLAISLATLTPFKAQAQPISDVGCSSYGMTNVRKYLTNNYRVYLCQDNKYTGLSSLFYLGGMRKQNVDHYILLGNLNIDGFGVWVHNNEYTYDIYYDPHYSLDNYITVSKNGKIISREKIQAVSNY